MNEPRNSAALAVEVKALDPRARLPERMSEAAAGWDLYACLPRGQASLRLGPLERCAVPTGLAMAIPVGFEGQVRPRSGLAFKHGISIPNAPGTIDADYRGELKVLLINLSNEPFELEHGERIAQIVFCAVAQLEPRWAESLPESARGSGGFGSTGR